MKSTTDIDEVSNAPIHILSHHDYHVSQFSSKGHQYWRLTTRENGTIDTLDRNDLVYELKEILKEDLPDHFTKFFVPFAIAVSIIGISVHDAHQVATSVIVATILLGVVIMLYSLSHLQEYCIKRKAIPELIKMIEELEL